MSLKLENRIAVVTGGSTGIGLETARQFALEGATVYITGRRKAELDAAAASIGPQATGVQVDSAKVSDLQHLADVIKAGHGRIDVLFVNAGGGGMVPLGEITEEHFDDTFARNVKGTLFTVQTMLPLLAEGASVILTGSTAASTGSSGFSVYGASKAAVRAASCRGATSDVVVTSNVPPRAGGGDMSFQSAIFREDWVPGFT